MNFPTPDFSTPDLGLKSLGLRSLGFKSSWMKGSWLKNLGLKLEVEKSGVEMSFNRWKGCGDFASISPRPFLSKPLAISHKT